ncbi:hypothetical protein ACIQPQ_34425 [Streptomyces sp. NPDC091281]|uniref:hypothetical protein n=1 Tax=Streptomyces sp. NPDC091281 TaxID=3365985 RepID=UPI00381B812E
MRFYVMSGPHQGSTGTLTEDVGEIQLPHPTTVGVHCRYKVNTPDPLIEQEGFEPGVQLHYAGDIATPR